MEISAMILSLRISVDIKLLLRARLRSLIKSTGITLSRPLAHRVIVRSLSRLLSRQAYRNRIVKILIFGRMARNVFRRNILRMVWKLKVRNVLIVAMKYRPIKKAVLLVRCVESSVADNFMVSINARTGTQTIQTMAVVRPRGTTLTSVQLP